MAAGRLYGGTARGDTVVDSPVARPVPPGLGGLDSAGVDVQQRDFRGADVGRGGGVETRQFPFFIVLTVVGLTLYPERCLALLGGVAELGGSFPDPAGGTAVRRILFRLVHGETTDCERALIRDERAWRGLTHVLPFLYIGLNMAYLARLGGDVFKYRPLDVYWPLLAMPAAV